MCCKRSNPHRYAVYPAALLPGLCVHLYCTVLLTVRRDLQRTVAQWRSDRATVLLLLLLLLPGNYRVNSDQATRTYSLPGPGTLGLLAWQTGRGYTLQDDSTGRGV